MLPQAQVRLTSIEAIPDSSNIQFDFDYEHGVVRKGGGVNEVVFALATTFALTLMQHPLFPICTPTATGRAALMKRHSFRLGQDESLAEQLGEEFSQPSTPDDPLLQMITQYKQMGYTEEAVRLLSHLPVSYALRGGNGRLRQSCTLLMYLSTCAHCCCR
jgi:hypothetical protein